MTPSLHAGDILSYSASSSQSGPDGFRRVRDAVTYLPQLLARWPALGQMLGSQPPLLINAYPAYIGRFAFGITVDTYLSIPIALRALQLAAREERTALMMAQPLFAAELIWRCRQQQTPMPRQVILACGGYEMPLSLEQALRQWLEACGTAVFFVYAYGLAELDAACLVGCERNRHGEVLYFPRSEAILVSQHQQTLHLADADRPEQIFDTGDQMQRDGEGLLITPAPKRQAPRIKAELAQWSPQDWQRRTGYLRPNHDSLAIQLRDGAASLQAAEYTHYRYAELFGFSWLQKPDWSEIPT